MRYIYTHDKSRITIDAETEMKAAQSFKEIAEAFFPDKTKERWNRETQEFYARPDVAPKVWRMTEKKTATIKARAPMRKARIVFRPKHFKFD